MKKFIALTAALVVLGAGSAFALLSGSAHDFTASLGLAEICQPCHTPHNADTTIADAPLWNHTVSTGAGGWTPYAGPGTLNATVGQPGSISILCLSCHDGTVAVDSFPGGAGTTFISTGNLDTDLTNDHPIGFVYDAGLATDDGALVTPTSVSAVGVDALPLFATYMECASCHDVHNSGAGPTKLLHVSNAGSNLCLNCHIK